MGSLKSVHAQGTFCFAQGEVQNLIVMGEYVMSEIGEKPIILFCHFFPLFTKLLGRLTIYPFLAILLERQNTT